MSIVLESKEKTVEKGDKPRLGGIDLLIVLNGRDLACFQTEFCSPLQHSAWELVILVAAKRRVLVVPLSMGMSLFNSHGEAVEVVNQRINRTFGRFQQCQ